MVGGCGMPQPAHAICVGSAYMPARPEATGSTPAGRPLPPAGPLGRLELEKSRLFSLLNLTFRLVSDEYCRRSVQQPA